MKTKTYLILGLFIVAMVCTSIRSTMAVEDVYEQNDTKETATLIGFGNFSATIEPAADADWYNFSVTAGDDIFIWIWETNDSLPILTWLYYPNGTYIDSDSSGKLLLPNAEVTGVYSLHVDHAYCISYSFSINKLPEDSFEPNEDFVDAKTINAGTLVSNLRLNDKDLYKIALVEDTLAEITVNRLSGARGRAYLEISTPSQVLYDTIYLDGSGTQMGYINVGITGDWYICIVPPLLDEGGNYTLQVEIFGDDPFEGNDIFGEAKPLSLGTTSDFALLDYDYYFVSCGPLEFYAVSVTRMGGLNSISLAIYNPSQSLYETHNISPNSAGQATFLSGSSSSADWYVVIENYEWNEGNYSITVTHTLDDGFELNQDWANAASVPATTASYTNLVALNDDYYKFDVTGGWFQVTFTRTSAGYGDVYFNIYEGQFHQYYRTSVGSLSLASFDWVCNLTGTYYIWIDLYSEEDEGLYTLDVEYVPDDAYEDNEISDAPIPLYTMIPNLVAMDNDGYSFSLVKDQIVTVTWTVIGSGGGYYLHITGGGLFIDNYISTGVNRFTFIAKFSTTHYLDIDGLIVLGWYCNRGNYTILIENATEDAYEENDNFAQAKSIPLNLVIPNLTCWDNDTFYFAGIASSVYQVRVQRTSGGVYDIWFSIYNPSQVLLQSASVPVSGNVMKEITATVSGNYFVKVYQIVGPELEGNYSLTITENDDIFEPNNDFASATAVSVGTIYQDLTFNNQDVYSFSIRGGITNIHIVRVGGTEYMNSYLCDTTHAVVFDGYDIIAANSYGDVNCRLTRSGAYYLVLNKSTTGLQGNYSFTITTNEDDIFEDNDNFNEAAVLTPGEYSNLKCMDTNDTYKIQLNASDKINVYFERISGASDDGLDFLIYNPSGTPIYYATVLYTPVNWNLTATTAGNYTILIKQWITEENEGVYTLKLATIQESPVIPPGGGDDDDDDDKTPPPPTGIAGYDIPLLITLAVTVSIVMAKRKRILGKKYR